MTRTIAHVKAELTKLDKKMLRDVEANLITSNMYFDYRIDVIRIKNMLDELGSE